MYPSFKELIEEKSEISLGASYWHPTPTKLLTNRLDMKIDPKEFRVPRERESSIRMVGKVKETAEKVDKNERVVDKQ
jgi:hypothetical protein